jgi:Ras-related protein R-Ras2
MREQYIRVGEGFLLVFSLNDRRSLEECYKIHRDILRIKDTDNVPILLIGNKFDIRQIEIDNHARNAANTMHIPYYETSARTRYNIDEIFIELVRIIRRNKCQIQMNNHNLKQYQRTSHCYSCTIL